MLKIEANNHKKLTKSVLVLPLIVLFVACSSKQIKNASTEPLDLPAEDSANYSAEITDSSDNTYFESLPTAAPVKSFKKKASKKRGKKIAAKGTVGKKSARLNKKNKKVSKALNIQPQTPAPTDATAMSAAATLEQELPQIGDSSLQSAPIEMPPIAPPIPPTDIEAQSQPNWLLAAFIIAGIVALGALALRVRRHTIRKRGLIYN